MEVILRRKWATAVVTELASAGRAAVEHATGFCSIPLWSWLL